MTNLAKDSDSTIRFEPIHRWMSRDMITAGPKMTLHDAHRLMRDHRIHHLPILENGRLVGLVTDQDIRRAEPSHATSLSVWEINYLVSKIRLDQLMRTDCVTIRETDSIADAAGLMMTYHLSGLPVLNEMDQLVGVITETDIFRLIVDREWHLLPT